MGEAAKLFTRALLMGADASARKNEFAEPTAGDIENLPYAEAVEYLKKRSVIKKVDYDKLSDKMRFRAFTVSRINDGSLLEKLNAEMLANVRDGKGLKDFLSLTKTEILDKVGMGPGQGWRWETVYRTNVQTAFNAGRAMGFAEDKPLALELIVIDDARTSDTCRQYAGRRFVLPYDHPFWQIHWPPFHFNCRTTIRAIYSEDELPEEWSNPNDIEDANNGFGANPLSNDNWWNELSSQVRQAKRYGVQGEIEAAKVALGVNANVANNVSLEPNIKNFESNDILNKYMENVKKDGNYFDVALHGTPTEVKYNGQLITARDLAKIIHHKKDFSRQNGIRLLSCSTGKGENCFAQNLANALGCEVKAPCDVLRVSPKGELFVDGNAGWKVFTPNMNGRVK